MTLIALLAGPTFSALAQNHAHSPAPGFPFGRQASPGAHHRHNSPLLSLFGDSFNLDDLYSSGDSSASQPPPNLSDAVRAMGGSADYPGRPENDREPPTHQPLMIELQGGRYVRVSNTSPDAEPLPLNLGAQNSGSKGSKSLRPNKTGTHSDPAPLIAAATPAQDLPPVVLVFRDGHSEEVRDYTIADGMLYARGDFYTDGYWNKKIDLSALDLTQTLQSNAAREVKFVLPQSPNEVITRP